MLVRQNQLPTEQVSLEDRKVITLDMVRIQKDAQELADLSASIRTDIEHANRRLLSKVPMAAPSLWPEPAACLLCRARAVPSLRAVVR